MIKINENLITPEEGCLKIGGGRSAVKFNAQTVYEIGKLECTKSQTNGVAAHKTTQTVMCPANGTNGTTTSHNSKGESKYTCYVCYGTSPSWGHGATHQMITQTVDVPAKLGTRKYILSYKGKTIERTLTETSVGSNNYNKYEENIDDLFEEEYKAKLVIEDDTVKVQRMLEGKVIREVEI